MTRRRKAKTFSKVTEQESLEMQAKHRKMNGKYLTDARKLLQQGDYLQASEKYWGAASQMIKLVAAKRGMQLGTHGSISQFVTQLDKEHPELELPQLYAQANSLHTNFYEDNLTPTLVRQYADAVKELIEKLSKIS